MKHQRQLSRPARLAAPAVSRRTFCELLAGASAVLALPANGLFSMPREEAGDDRRRGEERFSSLARTAIVYDSIGLCRRSRSLHAGLTSALSACEETALLAGMAPLDAAFVVDELNRLRDKAGEGALKPDDQERLAFVLGCVCYQAADSIDEMASSGSAEAAALSAERRAYRDAAILRDLLFPDGGPLPAATELESLLADLWQRTLIRWHTFIPDQNDIEGWIERVVAAHRGRQRYARLLSKAIAQPDAEKTRRYIAEPRFYRADDPIVRLARNQRNDVEDIDKAIQSASSQTRYAQAVGEGYQRLSAVGQFWRSRIDQQQLRDRLGMTG